MFFDALVTQSISQIRTPLYLAELKDIPASKIIFWPKNIFFVPSGEAKHSNRSCYANLNCQGQLRGDVTLAVVDSIKERCLQWISRDCWRMRLEDNMNPTIFMY